MGGADVILPRQIVFYPASEAFPGDNISRIASAVLLSGLAAWHLQALTELAFDIYVPHQASPSILSCVVWQMLSHLLCGLDFLRRQVEGHFQDLLTTSAIATVMIGEAAIAVPESAL